MVSYYKIHSLGMPTEAGIDRKGRIDQVLADRADDRAAPGPDISATPLDAVFTTGEANSPTHIMLGK